MLNEQDEIESVGIDPDDQKEIKIETSCELSDQQQAKFEEVKPIIAEKCSTNIYDLGRFTGDEMVIELTSQIPVAKPWYRRAQAEMDELEKIVQKLHKANIIEPSNSPYNNPAMTLAKKGSKKRRLIHGSVSV